MVKLFLIKTELVAYEKMATQLRDQGLSEDLLKCLKRQRKLSPSAARAAELEAGFTGLPEDRLADRYDVLHILRRIGRKIGISHELISHIEFILSHIPKREWLFGGCPVFFMSVTNQAAELGVSERQIRNRERALADLGFLSFHDSGNNRRYAVTDHTGKIVSAYGISLVPLIMRLEELQALDREREQDYFHWKQAKAALSSARKQVAALIAEASVLDGLQELIATWQTAWERIKTARASDTLELLRQRLDVVSKLKAEIGQYLSENKVETKPPEVGSEVGKTCARTHSTSSTEEVHFPCKESLTNNIQNSKEDYCNGAVDKNTADAKQIERANRLCGAAYLTPENVYLSASRVFRDAVDRVSGGLKPRQLTLQDIMFAGDVLLPWTGISPALWQQAKDSLGDYGAAIAMSLATQERVHIAPAYMRGLLQKHARNSLHLHKSIFGKLLQDQRKAKAPRTGSVRSVRKFVF